MNLSRTQEDSARWFRRPRGEGAAPVRLFCFHHAGGAASLYRDWPRYLPESIEPVAVQLPGRGERLREPPYERMEPLVAALAQAVEPLLDRPFAFFGLSMGARLAWALTHHMRVLALPQPAALYLSSASAPSEEPGRDDWKRDLVGFLRDMRGTPPEVLADPQLLGLVLPTLRADLTLLDSFGFRAEVPLDMPIRAFAGRNDTEHSPDRMRGWGVETIGRFHLDVRQGGHFLAPADELKVIGTVAGDLQRQLSLPHPPVSPELGGHVGQSRT
jgi:medium-chain acyl-[acyl-carrier-protein] hydrolase